MKWMVAVQALSDIWDTVNYHCLNIYIDVSRMTPCSLQSGIYNINVLHKALASLIGVELTSIPIYQKAYCRMTNDHFMVSFRS
jgi:hypothetical protein